MSGTKSGTGRGSGEGRGRRPAVAVTVLATLAALVLAGCGGGDDADHRPYDATKTPPRDVLLVDAASTYVPEHRGALRFDVTHEGDPEARAEIELSLTPGQAPPRKPADFAVQYREAAHGAWHALRLQESPGGTLHASYPVTLPTGRSVHDVRLTPRFRPTGSGQGYGIEASLRQPGKDGARLSGSDGTAWIAPYTVTAPTSPAAVSRDGGWAEYAFPVRNYTTKTLRDLALTLDLGCRATGTRNCGSTTGSSASVFETRWLGPGGWRTLPGGRIRTLDSPPYYSADSALLATELTLRPGERTVLRFRVRATTRLRRAGEGELFLMLNDKGGGGPGSATGASADLTFPVS